MCSGGVWTCPYAMESISTINWALGKSGYYQPGYIPEAALPQIPGEAEKVAIRDPEEVLKEMEVSASLCYLYFNIMEWLEHSRAKVLSHTTVFN